MQTSPVKAIREYCLGCCLGQVNEVKLCPDEECPLHPFRFGRNPYIKKTAAQLEAARKALEMARMAKNSLTVEEENEQATEAK